MAMLGRVLSALCCDACVNTTELPELVELQQIIDEAGSCIEHRVVGEVMCHAQQMQLHTIALGNSDPALPAVGFFGGVHGRKLRHSWDGVKTRFHRGHAGRTGSGRSAEGSPGLPHVDSF